MKLTSRMKFALLQRLIVNSVLFLILFSVMYFYVYGEILELEDKKAELSNTFEQYHEVKQAGITISTLKRRALAGGNTDNFHLRSILSEITPQFYSTHLTNTSSARYKQFLLDKLREINELKSSEVFSMRDDIINTILPTYSPNLSLTDRDISTADFINNLENLLHSFGLVHSGEIGITSIELVGSGDEDTSKQVYAENIFQIPVSFTLEGMKGNIVNFLHYISYMGSVTPDFDQRTLIPHNDSFLGGRSEAALFSESRYLAQIASIQGISFTEYIDSSTTQQSEDFFTRIRSSSQYRERYQVTLDMNFYVAGYPQFRIIEAINELHEALQADIKSMEEALKTSQENFESTEGSRVAKHRVAARIVTRLSDDLGNLTITNIHGLAESEILDLLTSLQRLRSIADITKQDYKTFF